MCSSALLLATKVTPKNLKYPTKKQVIYKDTCRRRCIRGIQTCMIKSKNKKQQYHSPFDLWHTPIYNSDRLDDLRFTVKLGEAGNSEGHAGSCPALPHRQMKARSVNGGRRWELAGRQGSFTAQRKALV